MRVEFDEEDTDSLNSSPDDYNTIEIKYREKTDEEIGQMDNDGELINSLLSDLEITEVLSDKEHKKVIICKGPDSIRFIFILCDVTIINNNSGCK